MYLDLGDLNQSRNAFEQAVRIYASQPETIRLYAGVLNNLSDVYQEMGQTEVGLKVRLKSLEIYEQNHDEDGVTRTCNNLAGSAMAENRLKDARKYIQCSEKAKKVSQHLDLDDMAAIFSMEGKLEFLEGNFPTALHDFQLAINLWRSAHGEQHVLTALGYLLRGQVYFKTGNLSPALADIARGLPVLEHTYGQNHPRYLAAESAYAEALDASGEHAEAAKIKARIKDAENGYRRSQCFGCTIPVTALR